MRVIASLRVRSSVSSTFGYDVGGQKGATASMVLF
jgi:hypothetical protein